MRNFRFLHDLGRILQSYRMICIRNSRSQIGPYSGLQTIRAKMRVCAGQMEWDNRRWIELGGRTTCVMENLLTHLEKCQYCSCEYAAGM